MKREQAGHCLFIMPKGKDFDAIRALISKSNKGLA